jgi:CRISPR type III-B/RAMP module-associated protein Cmr5
MKTQELKRATHAWQKVNAILGDEKRSKEWRDKYASYASSLPATILNCGLGQAAATLLAASKKADNTSDYDPHFQLYKDLFEERTFTNIPLRSHLAFSHIT